MSDPEAFLQFTAFGRFSGNSGSVSVPNETDTLDVALKTYLTSQALTQNGWYAEPDSSSWVDPNPYSALQDPSHLAPGVCTAVTNSLYTCVGMTEVFSQDTGRTYRVFKRGTGPSDGLYVMQQLESNSWADFSFLFDGAYNCTANGRPQSLRPQTRQSH